MAARKASGPDDIPQSDVLDGYSHPRRTPALIGQEQAEAALLEAYRSGRMHHGWMLHGPAGIGKATLAYRFAGFILTHPDPASPEVQAAQDLSIDPGGQAAHLVHAGSHPDLLALRRLYNEKTKRIPTILGVDEVRKVFEFFSLTAGFGGWRVAIIDCADDMNANAANALLKTLEEPPPRSVILLISHAPARLLPTLRSRCTRLALRPLDNAQLLDAVKAAGAGEQLEALGAEDRATLLALSSGSVRGALELLAGGALELHRDIAAILDQWPDMDMARIHKLGDKVARRGADREFDFTVQALLGWLAAMSERTQGHSLAQAAEVWEKLSRLKAETDIFHFDRKQVILKAFRSVASIG